MKHTTDLRLERLLAGLLRHGTRIASIVTGLGLLVAYFGGATDVAHRLSPILTVGIACFILLPVLRVVLTLVVFVRERDYRYIACTSIVLAIILAGLAIGSRTSALP